MISRSVPSEEEGEATLPRKLHNPNRAAVAFDHAATPGEEVGEAEHRRQFYQEKCISFANSRDTLQ